MDSAEWGIDPERIGAMGFSAGGHLAIRLAIEGDDGAVGVSTIPNHIKDVGNELRNLVQSIRSANVVKEDPEDDTILIVEGKADCIVSGDRHLKNLGSYQKIPILSPSEFLDRYKITE